MPLFNVEVHEQVHATIDLKVRAKTKEEAAQLAREAWVINGRGELNEAVEGRWVEIDGELIETKED